MKLTVLARMLLYLLIYFGLRVFGGEIGYKILYPRNLPIILMGGYLGSAIFGNLLFLIGAKSPRISNPVLGILGASMMFTSIYWFNSMFTSGFLIAFAFFLFIIVAKTQWAREVLMFLGLACIVYIIQDFNVGPSSDLNKYAEEMVFLPMQAWMYIWLGVVLILCYFNLKLIFRGEFDQVEEAVDEGFLELE